MANLGSVFNRLLAGVAKHPYATTSAVVAPALLSNDDRGYFATGAVTTPIIFGATKISSGLFANKSVSGTASAVSQAVQTIRGGSGIFGTNKKVMESYLKATPKGIRHYKDEQGALKKYFYKHFGISQDMAALTGDMLTGKTKLKKKYLRQHQAILATQRNKKQLISNALQGAVNDSLTPSEFATGGKTFSNLATNKSITEIFEQFADRPSFVQSLQHRLRKVTKLQEPGKLTTAETLGESKGAWTTFDIDDWSDPNSPRGKYMRSVEGENREVIGNLRQAYKKGNIEKVRILSQRVLDKGTGDAVSRGRVLAFEVSNNGGKNKFMINVANDNGEVILNHTTNQKGIARHFIAPNLKPVKSEVFLSELLADKWGMDWGADSKDMFRKLDEVQKVGNYWKRGDTLDPYKSQIYNSSMGANVDVAMNHVGTTLRSNVAIPAPIPIYGLKGNQYINVPGNAPENAIRMSPSELIGFQRQAHASGFYSQVNPDRSYNFVMQLADTARIHPFAQPDVFKQDTFNRSFSKDIRLFGDDLGQGTFNVTSHQQLFGGSAIPQMRTQVGGISTQTKQFYASLPATNEGFQGKKTFIAEDLRARNMSEDAVSATMTELEDIYGQGKQGVFAKFGQLGETELVMKPSAANVMGVETDFQYKLDEFDAGLQPGTFVSENTTLGFNMNTAVHPSFEGVVNSVERDAHGGAIVQINHKLGMNGAKFDIAGVKGLSFNAESDEEFDLMRDLNNRLASRTGDEHLISEGATALADVTYLHDKVNPVDAQLSMLDDISRRATALPDSPLKTDILGKLQSGNGLTYNNGLTVDSDYFMGLRNSGNIDAIENLTNLNQQIFKDVGDSIRKAGGSLDPLFNDFAKTSKTSYESFHMRNFAGAMKVWDHTSMFVADKLTHTYDMETVAAQMGNPEAVKALRDRAMTVGGGNAAQTLEFAEHILKNPGAPLPRVFSKEEAIMSTGSLTTAQNRAGTIFDPSIKKFAKPFSINMGTAENPSYLHLPGNDAYGGTAPQFETGRYQVWEWQKKVQQAINTESLNTRVKATQEALNAMVDELLSGKNSAFRPTRYDPKGLTGFLRTRTSENKFQVAIGEEQVNRITDRSIREKLLKGESAYGMMSRQPIADMKHVEVVYDKTMNGSNTIAASEYLYRPFQADADKDPVGLSMWEPGSAAEAEAKEAISSGRQAKQIDTFYNIFDKFEDSMQGPAITEETTLTKRLGKYIKGIRNPGQAYENAMAARKIGEFSNLLTSMGEEIIGNPDILADPERSARLAYGLFDIRQVAINARKSHNPFNLEQAQQLYDQFKNVSKISDPAKAGIALQDAMVGMAERISKKAPGEANARRDFFASSTFQEDLVEFARGRTPEAKLRFAAFTQSGHNEQVMGRLKQIVETGTGNVLGPVHSGTMADAGASTLGAVNEEISNTASKLKTEVNLGWQNLRRSSTAKFGLAAAGVAAAAILLTNNRSSPAKFNMPSSNKYRPEDRIGVEDRIPGEGVAGSQAPGNPVRRVVPAPQGITTAVVAPMQTQSNIEIQMRAEDKQRGIEQARRLANLTGRGMTSTSINVRGDSKLKSLQHREKMKNLREK